MSHNTIVSFELDNHLFSLKLTENIDVKNKKEKMKMSRRSRVLVPEAREALNRFKMEAANEVGVTLNQGYNGDKTSRENGSVGGQMVKKMISAYEQSMK